MSANHMVEVMYPAMDLSSNDQANDEVLVEPSNLGIPRDAQGVYQMHEPLASLFFYSGARTRAGRHDVEDHRYISHYGTDPDPINALQQSNLHATPVPATAGDTAGPLPPPITDSRLQDWIDAVSVYPGRSEIAVKTWRAPGEEVLKNVIRTHVLVNTRFSRPDGNTLWSIRRFRYTRTSRLNDNDDGFYHWPFPYGNSLHLSNIDNVGSQWAADLKSVILGSSERSLRHRILYYDSSANLPDSDPPWATIRGRYPFKPKRQPDYEAMLSSVLTKVKPDEGNLTSCPVCMNDFEWNDDEQATFTSPRTSADPVSTGPTSPKTLQPPSVRFAMALRRCPTTNARRHVICKPCVLGLCTKSKGPGQVACPQCRTPIFEKAVLNHLAYDVQENPAPFADIEEHPNEQYIFCNNPLYEDWENTLRSLSDLDEHDIDEDTLDNATGNPIKDYQLTIDNPDLLIDIWLDMVAADDTYPDDEAHRPTRMPEWRVIVQGVNDFWRARIGTSSTAVELYNDTITHVEGIFINLVAQGSRASLHKAADFAAARDGDEEAIMRLRFWRPGGLNPFLLRSLDRTFSFLRLRHCNCMNWEAMEGMVYNDEELYQSRKHSHGDREFYQKSVYDEIFLQPSRAARAAAAAAAPPPAPRKKRKRKDKGDRAYRP